MLQYDRNENHFNLGQEDGGNDAQIDTSYRQVVPKEYDYLSGSASHAYH